MSENQIKNIFQQKLGELGFVVVNEQVSESFGNFLIDMSNENLKIRLVSDKSILSVKVSEINKDDWIPMSTIICFLNNAEVLYRTEIDEQLTFFIVNLNWFLTQFSKSIEAINKYSTLKWKEHFDKL